RDIDTPIGKLLLCHGVGGNDMQNLKPDDTGYALETNDELTALLRSARHTIVVGGHTHERMVRRFQAPGGAPLCFVNAGTLAPHPTLCGGVLDCAARNVRFFDLDDPNAPRPAETFRL